MLFAIAYTQALFWLNLFMQNEITNKTMAKRLNKKNALWTPHSGTTLMINYSQSASKLEVEFTNRQVYHYLEVEPEKWEEYRDWIISGGSSGEFVNKQIKPFYEDERIK